MRRPWAPPCTERGIDEREKAVILGGDVRRRRGPAGLPLRVRPGRAGRGRRARERGPEVERDIDCGHWRRAWRRHRCDAARGVEAAVGRAGDLDGVAAAGWLQGRDGSRHVARRRRRSLHRLGAAAWRGPGPHDRTRPHAGRPDPPILNPHRRRRAARETLTVQRVAQAGRAHPGQRHVRSAVSEPRPGARPRPLQRHGPRRQGHGGPCARPCRPAAVPGTNRRRRRGGDRPQRRTCRGWPRRAAHPGGERAGHRPVRAPHHHRLGREDPRHHGQAALPAWPDAPHPHPDAGPCLAAAGRRARPGARGSGRGGELPAARDPPDRRVRHRFVGLPAGHRAQHRHVDHHRA